MSSTNESFLGAEGSDPDVAFISGEQGADPAQLRQNQDKEDDLPPYTPPASLYEYERWPAFVESGADFLKKHPPAPDGSAFPPTGHAPTGHALGSAALM